MTGTLAQAPLIVNGGAGQNNVYQISCGPPVYDYFTTACSYNVYITHPVNGSTLYWGIPSVTENVTVTLTGNPTSCQYRQAAGSWNNFTVCATGENATYSMVTMVEGYPQTLVVNITYPCGSITNSSSFTVYGRPGYIPNIYHPLLAPIIGLLLIVVMVVRRRRQRTMYT